MVQHPQLDLAVDQAAQRRRQGRHAHLPVRGVGHDDDVGREQVAVRVQERTERRRARLLLALEEDRDADRQFRAVGQPERTQRAEVGDDARLVVGGTAAEEPLPHLGGLERVGVPGRGVARRLHVVVRVQQDGRCTGGCRPARDDGGCAWRAVGPRRGQDLDVGQACITQELLRGRGARGDVRLVESGCRDARDAHQRLEISLQGGEQLSDAGAQGRGCIGVHRPHVNGSQRATAASH